MKEMNNIPFPKDKMNKVNYMWRDIERRAEGYGFFAKTPVPYPLSVEIALDGIEGFHFGDTITSDYLPERYRLNGGARVVFTVTKYTHTIKENDWQTDLTAVSRIVKDD